LRADEEQVFVVIVIVIEPDGGVINTAGEVGVFLEMAVDVAIERGAGAGDDAEIRQAIVIEIAGHDGDDVAQGFEPRIRHRRFAVAEELRAPAAPGDQAGPRAAIEIECNQTRLIAGESVRDSLVAIQRRGQGAGGGSSMGS
jgi:hypothetical protein